MSRILIAYLICTICAFAGCSGQSNTRIISLVSVANDKGEIQSKPDTLAIEYLDNHGHIFQKVETKRSGDEFFERTTFYNAQGKISGYVSNNNNESTTRSDLVKDNRGFDIMFKDYELNSRDTFYFDFMNDYDSNSRILKSTMINRIDGKVVTRSLSHFDSNKNLVEYADLDSLDNVVSKTISAYSESGRLLKQLLYEKGILTFTKEYLYIGDKKSEVVIAQPKGEKKARIKFVYE